MLVKVIKRTLHIKFRFLLSPADLKFTCGSNDKFHSRLKMIANFWLVIIHLILFQSCITESQGKESYSKNVPIGKSEKRK